MAPCRHVDASVQPRRLSGRGSRFLSIKNGIAVRAAGYRRFVTRRETVLRYREGTPTRQQYCRHHDAFEEGHVVSPTRRRTHLTDKVVCDTRPVIPPITTLRL